MKIQMAVILGMVMAGSAFTALADEQAGADQPKAKHEKKAAMAQSVYVCPDCQTMAMKAGKCSMCQKEMTKTHLLGMKDGQAMLCACEPGCKCDAKGMKDGKCGCGKDVKMMTPKGMYVCACAGSKCCTSISDKPGKCSCGMDMKKVE